MTVQTPSSRSSSVLFFLAVTAVYTVAWAPALGVFGDHPYKVLTAVGLGAPTAVLLGTRFHRTFPRIAGVLRIPYWGLLLALNLIFLPFSYCTSPPYFWAALGLASTALWLPLGRRSGSMILVASLLLMAVFTAGDLRLHAAWSAALFLAAGSIAAAATWALTRRGAFRSLSRIAFAFAALSLLIYPRSLLLYRFDFPGALPAVLAQPGVRAVYTYADPETKRQIPPQIMFLARMPGSDTYALGPQKPYHHLIFLEDEDPPRLTALELGSRGSDNLAFDPEQPDILYVGAGNFFHKISATPPRILHSLRLDRSIHNINFIHHSARGDSFFVSEDAGDQIFVVDRRGFAKKAEIPSPPWIWTDDVWLDPVGDLVLVNRRYFVGRRVDTYERSTLRHRNTYRWPLDYGFNFGTVDPEARRVYLASTVSGIVRVLDLDTLRPVDEFRLEPGLRNMNFDPGRRWVLLANYFRGTLHVYDVTRKRITGSVFLGTRLRWVDIDPASGNWYVSSSAGGFEIDPAEAFP